MQKIVTVVLYNHRCEKLAPTLTFRGQNGLGVKEFPSSAEFKISWIHGSTHLWILVAWCLIRYVEGLFSLLLLKAKSRERRCNLNLKFLK